MEKDIEEILEAYLICALWTNEEQLQESGCEDMNIHNIDEASKIKAKEDILKFMELAGDAVCELHEEQIGHDIWLTRNGHGAGFWDRGLDQEIEDALMNASNEIKGADVYIGDDGKIYFA